MIPIRRSKISSFRQKTGLIVASQKLLTIAIPTYNRARYLDLCLSQLLKQIGGNEHLVELIVSDNHSTDDTGKIVQNYISKSLPIRYLLNEANIGAERNVVQCFREASGRYVLILSDDDLLLDGALGRLLDHLKRDSYGIVHICACSYNNDFLREIPKNLNIGRSVEYTSMEDYIKKVNYFFTFISGNIVDKSLIPNDFDIDRFLGTNIPQLGWTICALLRSKKNLFVEEIMIAAKSNNSGGYPVARVFGTNMNAVFNFFEMNGVPAYYFKIIKAALVKYFFPWHILQARLRKDYFQHEDYYRELFPVFKTYWGFWVYTVPNIFLPVLLLRIFKSLKHPFVVWFERLKNLRRVSS